MKEELLQFIWRHRLFDGLHLQSCSGKELEIIQPGELNLDSGPDFFNARIRIEDLTLAGNIEVHVKTSDWEKHGHQSDPAYNNLILHVVYQHDKQLEQNSRHNVEVLELKSRIDSELLERYSKLIRSKTTLPCQKQLGNCPDTLVKKQLDTMLRRRLERRSETLQERFQKAGEDYSQLYYALLLRNFGFNLNADAFELIARNLPLKLLLRHGNDLLQVEALLLGTAGLLERELKEDYPRQLQREFAFLKKKYEIRSLESSALRYSKTRPGNFPDLRLAQFATLLHQHPEHFQRPQESLEYEKLMGLYEIRAQGYWQDHCRLELSSGKDSGRLGRSSAELLLINSLVPFMWFYAEKQQLEKGRQEALELLRRCAFEDNRKTRLFLEAGQTLKSASESQGCLELYDTLCSKKACLRCGIAAGLLKAERES